MTMRDGRDVGESALALSASQAVAAACPGIPFGLVTDVVRRALPVLRAHERERLGIDPLKLRLLAAWLDAREAAGEETPDEVQRDLRRWADALDSW